VGLNWRQRAKEAAMILVIGSRSTIGSAVIEQLQQSLAELDR
jgi:nucleoside-diphosphate-sugar epimerase